MTEVLVCELCEVKPAIYDDCCKDCAHPDDVEWAEFDPGMEY